MILVTVQYAAGSDFDLDYYLKKHIPLVKERWTPLGLRSAQVIQQIAKLDGRPPDFQVAALLTFESRDDFNAAGKAYGKEIMADIANFTRARASVQINKLLT
ncbi:MULTISPECIES: EthD family reductase [Bradyrhizobium]|uniref:EthD family reductase n=1 Tax=Bradyrhizobium TaxID=374 RepID=UPI000425524C|nr:MULTISPECIES: EthD family reductase [Bradyrhizobium]UFW51301.1 EthD family reductase [Bradyrhizobium arachidis]